MLKLGGCEPNDFLAEMGMAPLVNFSPLELKKPKEE